MQKFKLDDMMRAAALLWATPTYCQFVIEPPSLFHICMHAQIHIYLLTAMPTYRLLLQKYILRLRASTTVQ